MWPRPAGRPVRPRPAAVAALGCRLPYAALRSDGFHLERVPSLLGAIRVPYCEDSGRVRVFFNVFVGCHYFDQSGRNTFFSKKHCSVCYFQAAVLLWSVRPVEIAGLTCRHSAVCVSGPGERISDLK